MMVNCKFLGGNGPKSFLWLSFFKSRFSPHSGPSFLAALPLLVSKHITLRSPKILHYMHFMNDHHMIITNSTHTPHTVIKWSSKDYDHRLACLPPSLLLLTSIGILLPDLGTVRFMQTQHTKIPSVWSYCWTTLMQCKLFSALSKKTIKYDTFSSMWSCCWT